jgi:hypothetical protein
MRQAQRHLAEGLHPRVICEARAPAPPPRRRTTPAVAHACALMEAPPHACKTRACIRTTQLAHAPPRSHARCATHCAQGFDIAKKAALQFASELKVPVAMTDGVPERDIVASVARTALRTKLHNVLADQARGVACRLRAAALVRSHLMCLTYRHALAADGHCG